MLLRLDFLPYEADTSTSADMWRVFLKHCDSDSCGINTRGGGALHSLKGKKPSLTLSGTLRHGLIKTDRSSVVFWETLSSRPVTHLMTRAVLQTHTASQPLLAGVWSPVLIILELVNDRIESKEREFFLATCRDVWSVTSNQHFRHIISCLTTITLFLQLSNLSSVVSDYRLLLKLTHQHQPLQYF